MLRPDGSPLVQVPFARITEKKNLGTEKVRDTRWAKDEKPYAKINFQTTMTSGESHLLYDAAKRLGPGNYANLGVFTGKSVYCLGHGLKHAEHFGTIYAIDVFHRQETKLQIEAISQVIDEILQYVVFCKGFTHDLANRLKHLSFRFVFIDADHYYETAKMDWDLWSSLVDVGGEVAFHDTHLESVDQVVQEIDYSKWELIDHIYTTKLFKKL